jgi:basic membrane lipoprotein Med (substrate-binding protein (PBP1-ABC) superfamily)
MGGKFDKSFNQAAWEGAERWKQQTGQALSRVRDRQRRAA